MAKPSGEASRSITRFEAPRHRASFSVNLTISPEISPERLKEYIKAMLEAYDEHSQKKASEKKE